MRRVELAALLCLVLLGGRAAADDEPQPARDATPSAHAAPLDLRGTLVDQLTQQVASIASARAIVRDKLTAADAARLERARAAYRIISVRQAELAPADQMADARRRAAARLLLERDAVERGLLADEAASLDAAAARTAEAAVHARTIALPADLAWPARGTIAHHFGTIEHERSHTTLSRRGIDLEVDDHAPALASADGIVRYAGPIRGLDRGVIIEHGEFFTVIAKLGDLVVPVGAPVHKGDRLGRAARHRIYFEVRVRVGPGGLAVDPEPLFAKR